MSTSNPIHVGLAKTCKGAGIASGGFDRQQLIQIATHVGMSNAKASSRDDLLNFLCLGDKIRPDIASRLGGITPYDPVRAAATASATATRTVAYTAPDAFRRDNYDETEQACLHGNTKTEEGGLSVIELQKLAIERIGDMVGDELLDMMCPNLAFIQMLNKIANSISGQIVTVKYQAARKIEPRIRKFIMQDGNVSKMFEKLPQNMQNLIKRNLEQIARSVPFNTTISYIKILYKFIGKPLKSDVVDWAKILQFILRETLSQANENRKSRKDIHTEFINQRDILFAMNTNSLYNFYHESTYDIGDIDDIDATTHGFGGLSASRRRSEGRDTNRYSRRPTGHVIINVPDGRSARRSAMSLAEASGYRSSGMRSSSRGPSIRPILKTRSSRSGWTRA